VSSYWITVAAVSPVHLLNPPKRLNRYEVIQHSFFVHP